MSAPTTNEPAGDPATYLARVEALDPQRQRALAERLAGRARVDDNSRRETLVAWVCPRDTAMPDAAALREHLVKRLPDYMVPQRLVMMDRLPRTPANKLDRDALSRRDPGPAASPIIQTGAVTSPRTDTETVLARIWAEVLGLDEVSVDDDFFEVGGDSLLSIRVLARAGKAGIRISPEDFFARPTIAQQAAAAVPSAAPRADQGIVTGAVPLTPIQHWFFRRITAHPQQWNQSALFDVTSALDLSILERAVDRLMRHHDALRLVVTRDGDGWSQHLPAPGAEVPVIQVDDASDDSIEATALSLNVGMSFDGGELIRFALFPTAGALPPRLLIVAHHLVVDAVSWRLIVEDLETLCRQLLDGHTPALAEKTASLRSFSEALCRQAQTESVLAQLPVWQRIISPGAAPLPTDFEADPGDNIVASARSVSVSLAADVTRKLSSDTASAFRARVDELLMASMASALSHWVGADIVLLDTEGHGRDALGDALDVSRTVGWLTTVFPVRLELPAVQDPVGLVSAVKNQLRAIPDRGAGHGLLRDLCNDPAAHQALDGGAAPQLLFNYLGQIDRMNDTGDLLTLVRENIGPVRSPHGNRAYLIEVNARIEAGCLVADFSYSERFHRADTIETLAAKFIDTLESIVRGDGAAATAVTPADFPLAGIDQDDLDAIGQLLDDD